MHTPCPHCESPLAAATVGFMCTNCGRLYRYAEPDDLVDGHADTSNQLSHGTAYTASSNGQSPDSQAPEESIQPTAETADISPVGEKHPQIINHHASSHYRRRLHERIHALERPELEPPDDTHALSDTNEVHTDDTVDRSSNLAGAALAATSFAPSEHAESVVSNNVASQGEQSTPDHSSDTREDELWGPHKPSPHVLDVASSAPEEPENDHMPISPLDLRDIDTQHTPPQGSALHTSSAALKNEALSPIHTQSRSQPSKDSEALAKADALLAAARTPAPDKNSANLVWLGITAVIVIALASFLAFYFLKPPTPQQSVSPSPNSIASQSPTSTQSASSKRDAQRKADLNDIAVGLSAYQKATGKYPVGNDISVLQPLTTANPPFIKVIHNDPNNDPANGIVIKYSYTSDGVTYTLAASLENKSDPDAKNGLYIVKSSTN